MRYRYIAPWVNITQTTVLDLSARGKSLIVKKEEYAIIGQSRLIMHVLYRDKNAVYVTCLSFFVSKELNLSLWTMN